MKIGIMGGTFDPIHDGHLMLAEYAYQLFNLDEIWFLPNGNPPHKNDPSIQKDTRERVRMVELAIADVPYFKLCDYEIKSKKPSYSYQTMEYLKKTFPDNDFYFIIGADSLFAIEKWSHPEKLIRTVTILAAYRDDMDTPEEMHQQIDYLNQKYDGDIRLLRTPLLPVSSSEIRSQIESGISEHLPVPESVEEYIRKNHLYQGDKYDGNIK